MTRTFRATLLAAAGIAAVPAAAQSDAAKRFGAREQVISATISPDGNHYAAVLATAGRKSVAIVGDVAATATLKPILQSSGAPERLTDCNWATNARLVCGIYAIDGKGSAALGFTRLFALDPDGSKLKLISAKSSLDSLGIMQNGGQVIDWYGDESGGSLLMLRQFVPEKTTGTYTASALNGYGLERIDPVTFRRTVVETPRPEIEEFITDGHGTVRIMGVRPQDSAGYGKTFINYMFRKPGERSWNKLSTVTGDSQTRIGFDPYAVDRDLNVAYGFDVQNGRSALFKMALDGSGKRDIVYGRPDVDIDGLVRIGRQRRVVGVTFATDRRETAFFDPELKRLQAALSKAIPELPLIRFIDASADEKKLLLWAGSDVDPGRYLVFDKSNRHLDLLLPARPQLEGFTLAPVKAITYAAADGTKIPGYLTVPAGKDAKNLPTIVMPHGGPSARDEWGFDWLAQFFAARGYAVLQPNFRGSSGYGDSWFQENGFRSWKTAIGDVNDGGRWLVKEGIADPKRLAIVGWSYGGYAALQSPVLAPDLFKAIVAIAPVTDLATLREEHRDFSDFRLVDTFIGRGDHVKEGSPAQNVAAIKAPVLLFHADQDRNVGIGESRMMASRLRNAGKQVELVEYKGLDHQIDDSDARIAMLDKADTFLRTTLGIEGP
ncbi:Dipeptidyl aminopeptidase/acylaminoacyl peptidase [Sphingomonas sp. EC-HK361]|uniref:alpha/beta hydrolase family protein n=1 Tax=Sphingomonas sp. EC-HK361 TaxID=2038397 RepID=UPI00125B5C58|nr:S9 family peptidase [Sphingomonas sp. EC-HK361]VVT04750.1 Dipeptidyl aminopeptidase/acylaminoacyl peptidase [Sphingomonas sp. EC-HK361]